VLLPHQIEADMVVDTIQLYISAANDLTSERELIGQMVTEIPVTLGWQINFSPVGKNLGNEKLVLEADYHLIIFGEDIRAPIGYEWHLSRTMGRRPPFIFKANTPRTIAGRDFLKKISSYPKLLSYNTHAELRKLVLTQIGQHIIEHADHYAIKGLEYDEISKFIENLEEIEPNILDNVTGEDSIILTRERFLPKDGVLIQTLDDEPNTE
jgi:hypothetical protein